MADVLLPTGRFITWAEALHRGADMGSELAFHNLISNLKLQPELRPRMKSYLSFSKAYRKLEFV